MRKKYKAEIKKNTTEIIERNKNDTSIELGRNQTQEPKRHTNTLQQQTHTKH
jgi:hypothetical protein